MYRGVICKDVGRGQRGWGTSQTPQEPRAGSSRTSTTFRPGDVGRGAPGLWEESAIVQATLIEGVTSHLGPALLIQPHREGLHTLSSLFPILESLLVLPIGQTRPQA